MVSTQGKVWLATWWISRVFDRGKWAWSSTWPFLLLFINLPIAIWTKLLLLWLRIWPRITLLLLWHKRLSVINLHLILISLILVLLLKICLELVALLTWPKSFRLIVILLTILLLVHILRLSELLLLILMTWPLSFGSLETFLLISTENTWNLLILSIRLSSGWLPKGLLWSSPSVLGSGIVCETEIASATRLMVHLNRSRTLTVFSKVHFEV